MYWGHVSLQKINSKLRVTSQVSCMAAPPLYKRQGLLLSTRFKTPGTGGFGAISPCSRQVVSWWVTSYLRGKWHTQVLLLAVPDLLTDPFCQECRRLQNAAREEGLMCERVHEHGLWLKDLINVNGDFVPPVNINTEWISTFLVLSKSWEWYFTIMLS